MVYFFISTYFSIDKQSCKETYTLITIYIYVHNLCGNIKYIKKQRNTKSNNPIYINTYTFYY